MAHFSRPECGPCSKGRVPASLIIGLVLSVSLHLALLFAAQFERPREAERPMLMAELRPQALPVPRFDKSEESARAESKPAKPVVRKLRAKKPKAAPVLPLPTVAEPSSDDAPEAVVAPASDVSTVESASEMPNEVSSETVTNAVPENEASAAVPTAPHLPPRGVIHYRVDSGERNFQIGIARQEWEVSDAYYRLKSELETVGIAWLFKSYHLEMESRGRVTEEGLLPEFFEIRRNGKEAREKALFDWERMVVKVGNRAEQSLDQGAQDFLSFNYQLGFMQHPASGSTLPLTTGKKYAVYQLVAMADEDIVTPMGDLRTLHLHVPGENIDLWLAYDYLLLPVKIRFVDRNDQVFIQVATQIQTSPP